MKLNPFSLLALGCPGLLLASAVAGAAGAAASAYDINVEEAACYEEPRVLGTTLDETCALGEAAFARDDIGAVYDLYKAMVWRDPTAAHPCTRRLAKIGSLIFTSDRRDYRAGLEAMKLGDFMRARACLRLVVGKDPYNVVGAKRLADVQVRLDELATEAWSQGQLIEQAGIAVEAMAVYRQVVEYSASKEAPLAVLAQQRIAALLSEKQQQPR